MVASTLPPEPPHLPHLRAIGALVGLLRGHAERREPVAPETLQRLADRLEQEQQALWHLLVEQS